MGKPHLGNPLFGGPVLGITILGDPISGDPHFWGSPFWANPRSGMGIGDGGAFELETSHTGAGTAVTDWPREAPDISSSGPKNKLLGFCAESGLKSCF